MKKHSPDLIHYIGGIKTLFFNIKIHEIFKLRMEVISYAAKITILRVCYSMTK